MENVWISRGVGGALFRCNFFGITDTRMNGHRANRSEKINASIWQPSANFQSAIRVSFHVPAFYVANNVSDADKPRRVHCETVPGHLRYLRFTRCCIELWGFLCVTGVKRTWEILFAKENFDRQLDSRLQLFNICKSFNICKRNFIPISSSQKFLCIIQLCIIKSSGSIRRTKRPKNKS